MKKGLTFITVTVLALSFLTAGAEEIADAPQAMLPSDPVMVIAAEPQAEEQPQNEGAIETKLDGEEAATEEQTEVFDAETEDESIVVPEGFTGSVKVELVNTGALYFGDEIILRARVENANVPYTLRWELNDGKEWKPISGENKPEYHFIVDETNVRYQYRVVVITED